MIIVYRSQSKIHNSTPHRAYIYVNLVQIERQKINENEKKSAFEIVQVLYL